MFKPKNSQIEEAKQYLLSRLSAEQVAQARLLDLLETAALKIYSVAKKYKIRPSLFKLSANKQMKHEINAIIDELIIAMTELTNKYALSSPVEKDRDEILLWANRDINGLTFKQRLNNHVSDFKFSVEQIIASALAAKVAVSKFKSFADISNISSTGRLSTLSRYTIADAWMKSYISTSDMFYSMRGSSYPCDLCDSMVGPHPAADYVGPWHPRCCCLFIPLY